MKKLRKIRDAIDDRLKTFCGELTPGKRLAFILTWMVVFGGFSLYYTFSSIYRMGQKSVTPDIIIEKETSLQESFENDKNMIEYEYE